MIVRKLMQVMLDTNQLLSTSIIAHCDLLSMGADQRKPFIAKGSVRESFPIKIFKMIEHIDLHEPAH